MSVAGWFVVLLALICANLPFASERLFCVVELRSPEKSVLWRIAEFIILYGIVIAVGFALEAHAGDHFPQGLAFYVITFCLFTVFAFPGFTWRYLVRCALSRFQHYQSGMVAKPPNHDIALKETREKSETIYTGSFLTLKRDTVLLPDGKQTTREFLEHPGAVMILPLLDDGRVVMENQYRYPVARVMAEFPAGKLGLHEDALACARRELQEETGYTAREFVYLTRIHPVISYSTESIDLYLARGLTAGERHLDEGEFLEIFTATLDELLEWIRTGQITDVKTIIGAFWLEKVRAGAWPLKRNTA